uniref:Reverse transcriptase domain-containing protein n=1 Tax=Xenopus tropicalis TaxID=8364 RepID=A0A803K3M7_XENTR
MCFTETQTGTQVQYPGLKKKSNYLPDVTSVSLDTFVKVVTNEVKDIWDNDIGTKYHPNLTKRERHALITLKNNHNIIIKKADKGGAVVVLDRDKYNEEVMRLLNIQGHYCTIDSDPTGKIKNTIDTMVYDAFLMGTIDKSTRDFLTTEFPKIPLLYILPKIHKTLINPPGRPIVSGVGSVLEPLSKFVDFHLQKLVSNLPTCLKDTTDLLNKLNALGPLEGDIILCSIDIESLFTSIPQEEALSCVENALLDTNLSNALIYFILDCLEIVLKKNYFMYDGQFFWQQQGTSMGSAVAPSLANLFVYELEKKLFLNKTYLPYIKQYFRYVDDTLILWVGPIGKFEQMVSEANKSHPTVKFTFETSTTEINFLDVNIKLDGNKLVTGLYRKKMDRNNLLHIRSCHHPLTLKAIPKGQYIRARKIASNDSLYRDAANDLTKRFMDRGYPKQKLEHVANEVGKLPREQLLKPKSHICNDNRMTFVGKFDKKSRKIENVIRKYWPILQSDTKHGSLFSKLPRFAYKRGSSLKDILCPTQSFSTKTLFEGKPKIGTFPCMECNCCSSIIKGSNIHHPLSGVEIPLKAYATCKSKFVIYVLKCPCGMLYVGKTFRPVNTRIKEHKNYIRNFKKDSYTDTSVSRHFIDNKHSACQLKWKVLEVVQKPVRGGDWKKLLLQREARWIRRLDCVMPRGMNEQYSLLCFL